MCIDYGPLVFCVPVHCVNVVCIDNRPWDRAMDRVHRLGQTRDVEVVRFAAADSIEEKMMELQQCKRELAKAAFEKKSEAERQAMRKADLTLLLSINNL